MRIIGQRDDAGALAPPVFSDNPEVRSVKVARFAKLSIAACTAIMLVGLYVGMKYSYAIGTFTAEQSRVFHIDVSEACLHGTEPAPVFEAKVTADGDVGYEHWVSNPGEPGSMAGTDAFVVRHGKILFHTVVEVHSAVDSRP